MASDVSIPPELGMFQLSRTMQFMGTERPWLKLYGIRVRPVAPFGSMSSRPFVDPALIHRCLPDELLMEVFALLDPYSLGRAACVCRKWKYTIRNPSLWRSACLKVWQLSGAVANYKFVQAKYEGSWRKMWLRRPRIRNDGLYVSRNTYIRTGASQWNITNTLNVVCYYRYLRFYHNGKFLYKVSSQKVKEVAKCMNFRELKSECVFKGSYTLTEDQVEAVLLYPGLCRTLLRIRLRIRGTTLGANNRMDLLRLVTTGIDESEINNDDIFAIIEGWQEDETHDPDIPAITHTRGLTPFVFVPFEEVETSVLNLPVDKMDYYVTG